MEIRYLWALAKRWFWLVVTLTIVAAVAAFAFSVTNKPVYRASTTVLINLATNPGDISNAATVQGIAPTYVELAKSRAILEKVIAETQIPLTVEAFGKIASVQSIRNTLLLEMTVDYSDAESARDIVNKWAEIFIAENLATQHDRFAEQLGQLQTRIATSQQSIKSASEAIAALQSNLNMGNQLESQAELNRLQTELSFYENQYAGNMSAYDNMLLLESRSVNKITVTEPSVVQTPSIPIKPQPMKDTLLGAVVGLILGLCIVFVREFLDDTVKTSDEVERVTGFATLAEIGRVQEKTSGDQAVLVTRSNPDSSVAEAYRLLRATIQFAAGDDPIRVVLVTSPSAGEGKTTIVGNLAVAFAQDSQKVIAVDANVQQPALHTQFSVNNDVGFADLLAGTEVDIANAIQPTGIDGVSVVTSGSLQKWPNKSFNSNKIAEVFTSLSAMADIILIDGSPIFQTSNALTAAVDGIILVAENRKTKSDRLVQSVRLLELSRRRIIGVVLNKVPFAGFDLFHREHDIARNFDEQGKTLSAKSGVGITGGGDS